MWVSVHLPSETLSQKQTDKQNQFEHMIYFYFGGAWDWT